MSRQPFNTRWAQSVETDNPSSQSPTVYQDPGSRLPIGWEGGADKDAPPAGQENWWHNRVDSALQDMERFGVMTWVAGAIYAAGAPVKSLTDGNYYESLVAANSGQDPTSTSGYWRLLGSSLYSVIPVGSGVTVYHNDVPDIGWLKCNGAVLLRSTYPRLFAKIGTIHNIGGESSTQFRLPDMRGEFPRGWDDSRGIDAGRVLGSAQGFQVEAHSHVAPTAVSPSDTGTTWEVPAARYNQYDYAGGAPTQATGGNETRPRNKAVNFWIKY